MLMYCLMWYIFDILNESLMNYVKLGMQGEPLVKVILCVSRNHIYLLAAPTTLVKFNIVALWHSMDKNELKITLEPQLCRRSVTPDHSLT